MEAAEGMMEVGVEDSKGNVDIDVDIQDEYSDQEEI